MTTTKRFLLTLTLAAAAASPLSADGFRYPDTAPNPTAVIQPVGTPVHISPPMPLLPTGKPRPKLCCGRTPDPRRHWGQRPPRLPDPRKNPYWLEPKKQGR